jgi:hypothetical protein
MNEKKEKNLLRYAWLVNARYKNQCLLVELYEFHNAKMSEQETTIFNQLLGIAFSLWRGAFLTEKERNSETILDNAEYILERLIADNAINYTQDMAARQWMSGYYLNNVRLRINRIRERMNLENINFQSIDKVRLSDIENLQQHWDTLHDLTFEIFKNLKQERKGS